MQIITRSYSCIANSYESLHLPQLKLYCQCIKNDAISFPLPDRYTTAYQNVYKNRPYHKHYAIQSALTPQRSNLYPICIHATADVRGEI